MKKELVDNFYCGNVSCGDCEYSEHCYQNTRFMCGICISLKCENCSRNLYKNLDVASQEKGI